jgi:hypothetical protein
MSKNTVSQTSAVVKESYICWLLFRMGTERKKKKYIAKKILFLTVSLLLVSILACHKCAPAEHSRMIVVSKV